MQAWTYSSFIALPIWLTKLVHRVLFASEATKSGALDAVFQEAASTWTASNDRQKSLPYP